MTATADPQGATPPKKRSKLPMVLGLVLALAGGAGGFFAVRTGLVAGFGGGRAAGTDGTGDDDRVMLESGGTAAEDGGSGLSGADDLPALGAPSFVALDPIVVNLPPGSRHNLLRMTALLDVPEAYVGEIESIRPRIVDVLNGYLRAVEVSDLEDRAALTRLRSQMLRRVQVVTGEGRVRDLLINEFVFN